MIFYENLEHYGIKIANFINFCKTIHSKILGKPDYGRRTFGRSDTCCR